MIKSLLNKLFGRGTSLDIGSPEANALVIVEIKKQGDDGQQERHVKHTAYPSRDGGALERSQVVDLFAEVGLDPSELDYRGGILGEHYAAVSTPEFDTLTTAMRIALAEMGWEYDGWECAILREK